MATPSMLPNYILSLIRLVKAILACIVLFGALYRKSALTCSGSARKQADQWHFNGAVIHVWGKCAAVPLAIITAAMTLLVLPYLLVTALRSRRLPPAARHPFAIVGVETVLATLWLASWILVVRKSAAVNWMYFGRPTNVFVLISIASFVTWYVEILSFPQHY